MQHQQQIEPLSFKHWIWGKKENKVLLITFCLLALVSFLIFKHIYPYPNFTPDSQSYINAAFNNKNVNHFPIGYSKFLRLFRSFTTSPIALILFQYFLLQSSLLYFLFTIKFLVDIRGGIFILIYIITALNPLPLYLSNMIAADALFTALTLIWSAQLFFIFAHPKAITIFLHSLTLLFAFTIRYNALYYPIVSIAVILLSPTTNKIKFASVGLTLILIGSFIGYTQIQYQKITSVPIFIPAAGWQLSANALDAAEQIQLDSGGNTPYDYKKLQGLVIRHIDSLDQIEKYFDKNLIYYYQYNQNSPLFSFMSLRWLGDTSMTGFRQWASMGSFYKNYGEYLIANYPMTFIKYYLGRNLLHFFTPPLEFIGRTTTNRDSVSQLIATWFGLKKKNQENYPERRQHAGNYLMFLVPVFSMLFPLAFGGYWISGPLYKHRNSFNNILKLAFLLWVSNFLFSIWASPIVLRTQVSSITLSTTFAILILAAIFETPKLLPAEKKISKKELNVAFPGKVGFNFIKRYTKK